MTKQVCHTRALVSAQVLNITVNNWRWNAYRALAGLITPSLIGIGKDRHGNRNLDFRAQDCRDTAVTRLVNAGLTDMQVASWHGSSPTVIRTLAENYIDLSPDLARTGPVRLKRVPENRHHYLGRTVTTMRPGRRSRFRSHSSLLVLLIKRKLFN